MALFRPTYRRDGILHRSPFWRFEYRIDGTPKEIQSSTSAYLRQFVNALPDGPVRFHFPGAPLEEDLRLSSPDRA